MPEPRPPTSDVTEVSAARSRNMSRIRGCSTRPELALRRLLWRAGLRYRLGSELPGRPDLVFRRARVAVFLDGCYWHGCPVHYSAPTTRRAFWQDKLRNSVLRDLRVDDALRRLEWLPLRLWQHDLRSPAEVVGRVRAALTNADESPVPGTRRGGLIEVREARPRYGAPWYACACGSRDVCVVGTSGPGSLRPGARRRPDTVRLLCRGCRVAYERPSGGGGG